MSGPDVPILHVDRPLTDADREFVADRAILVGPGDDTLGDAVATVVGVAHHWDAARFERFPNLRIVSRMGIGYDNIEVEAARAAGVIVCNAPDAPTVSTAEHAMALLLAVTKRLLVVQNRASAGLAGVPDPTSLELDGSTLGLVGIGRIGERVARAALGFDMEVIAHDPGLDSSPVDGVDLVPLDDVFERSHVVSLHAPAVPETHHLVNAESISRMRRGVYLVNCARGSLVDHDALLAALESGHVAGAGLDVTDPEPLPVEHPLLGRADVIVTPHVASSTRAGRRRLFEHAVDNVFAVLEGRPASVVT